MTKDKKNLYEVLIAVFSGFSMVAVYFTALFEVHPLILLALSLPFLIGIPIYIYLPFKYWETNKRVLPKLSFLTSVLVAWSVFTLLILIGATLGYYINQGETLDFSMRIGFLKIIGTDNFPIFNFRTYILAALIYAVFNEICKSKFKDKIEVPDVVSQKDNKIDKIKAGK